MVLEIIPTVPMSNFWAVVHKTQAYASLFNKQLYCNHKRREGATLCFFAAHHKRPSNT